MVAQESVNKERSAEFTSADFISSTDRTPV